jgi:hypothetical protein
MRYNEQIVINEKIVKTKEGRLFLINARGLLALFVFQFKNK